MFALNSSANSLLPDNVVNEKPTLAADQSTTYLILQANLSTPCNNYKAGFNFVKLLLDIPRQFFNGEFDNHKKPSPDIVSSSLFTSLECNWRCIKRSASKSGSFSCPTMTAVIFQIFTSHTKVENIYLLAVWWKTDGKISRLNIAIMVQLTRLCEGRKYLPMSHWQGVKLCEVFIKLLPTRLIATQLYLSPFLPRSKTAQQCVEFISANFWRTSTSSRSVRTS
ncbi:hypothetical protein T02_11638 [Trichinella nativa]|uniref:Uncharacterized protein n=1 Tax=Trichinella nativa TaxID=6335 RepID=A0A0V1LKS3_9BILA|nr:hypothetical protein T02_11638 [Trichinella nativa]